MLPALYRGAWHRRRVFRPLTGLAALLLLLVLPVAAGERLTVFAAASLSGPMRDLAALYEQRTGSAVTVSHAASSTLARQIEAGAPADVYVSANAAWMDYLAERGLIALASRFDWVGNSLVVVAPVATAPAAETLDGLLADARIAAGDPDHVPAGQYARAALVHNGLWERLSPRMVRSDNVRAALALVARGEVAFGIVYATDAALERGVRIVFELAADSHPPIVYPVAAVAGAPSIPAGAFLDFLRSDAAMEIMRGAGFLRPPG